MGRCAVAIKSLAVQPRQTRWLALLIVILLPPTVTTAFASPATQPHVEYMIIVTGGELLAGSYPDGHTHFLTRTLLPLGLRCVGSMSVDDRPTDIKEAIRFARSKTSLVIITGGLGPTDNDITRETLSDCTAIALQEHPDVLREMQQRLNVKLDQLRPNLRRQAQVPTRGTYLKNPNGTAVGLVFELGDAVIVALPGPPRELQPMAREQLVPYLSKRFGTRLPGCSLTLRFVGLGQSQINQTLKDHVPLPSDVVLSSQFEGGRVDFTFALPDDTPQARERLRELKGRILRQLGEHIYAEGETSLEEHVVGLIAARGTTITLAEVGSSGSLAAALAGANNAREVMAGAYVAVSDEQLGRMLGAPAVQAADGVTQADRIKALATAAAKLAGKGWVVVVGEAWQDANGGRWVEVALRSPDGRIESQKVALRGSGELARSGAVTQILDHLRRRFRSVSGDAATYAQ